MTPVVRAGLALGLAAASLTAAHAHGVVGQRFFPATLATEDPFVADELSLPTFSTLRFGAGEEGAAGRQSTLAIDFARRITADFGVQLGTARQRFTYGGALPRRTGQDNLELGAKLQLHRDDDAESILAVGLGWDVGGTGSRGVGESFSTFTPTVYWGKGFGALDHPWLRPLAATGTLGVAIPGRAGNRSLVTDPDTGASTVEVERNPRVLQVGLALHYSLPYLQSAVQDLGLGAPWNRLVPIVELAAERPLDRVDERRWTGTLNPGVLWTGKAVQLGLEAVLPLNHASGRGVGLRAQLHFFLDDLVPGSFGRPLLGAP